MTTTYILDGGELDLSVPPGAGRAVVAIRGEVDWYTAPVLRDRTRLRTPTNTPPRTAF